MTEFTDIILSFVTLIILEIVQGLYNLIFLVFISLTDLDNFKLSGYGSYLNYHEIYSKFTGLYQTATKTPAKTRMVPGLNISFGDSIITYSIMDRIIL